jgi:hypothetical protein
MSGKAYAREMKKLHVRMIIETCLAPNRTSCDVEETLDNDAINPLRDFGNTCRRIARARIVMAGSGHSTPGLLWITVRAGQAWTTA